MLYIIGEPGIGKSTLVAVLTAQPNISVVQVDKPFAMRMYSNGVLELGGRRGEFSGTDMLAMDVQPKVLDLLAREGPPLVLAEGDRLANSKFFAKVVGMGYRLWPVYLSGSALARQRRSMRSLENGTVQNQSWVRGRISKHAKLALTWDAWELHPVLEPQILAKILPSPVAAAFR